MSSAGYVKDSSIFDMTFLNAFHTDIKGNMLGARYGYAQFILLICVVLVCFFSLLFMRKMGFYTIVFYIIQWVFVYVGVSCYLIPNEHERCFIITWIFSILPTVSFTLLIIIAVMIGGTIMSAFRGGKKTKKLNTKKKTETKKPKTTDELLSNIYKNIINGGENNETTDELFLKLFK
tara:strand:- start:278 stop:808 length:531 start_codon:yes stop_codon:yes gene_type:complete